MSTTYDTDMFEPLAIGNWTLKAEVSDDSRTSKSSGSDGRERRRAAAAAPNVDRAERDDRDDVPAARGAADPGARPPVYGEPERLTMSNNCFIQVFETRHEKSAVVLLVLLVARRRRRRHLRLRQSSARRAGAHRHRHHQRRHRQPADRRPDRPAAGQRRRRGQEGPAARGHRARRAAGRERLLRAERRRAVARRSASAKRRCGFRSGRPTTRSARPSRRSPSTEAQVERGRGRARERAADLRRARRTCRSRASSRRRSSTRRARRSTRRRRKLDALKRQVEAQRAAVALARSNAEQIAVRRSQVQANAAHAGRRPPRSSAKADVRLAYTEIHAPIDGIVDVRAARVGRSRHARPADRDADQPRRPLGARRRRGDLHRSRAHRRHADGPPAVGRRARRARCSTAASTPAFATQRDVSRTKRDIKTFEVRLRVDNKDRRLAVGMTAYVLLPLGRRRHDCHRRPAASSRSSATSPPSTASASPSRRARSSACSARTAPASRR